MASLPLSWWEGREMKGRRGKERVVRKNDEVRDRVKRERRERKRVGEMEREGTGGRHEGEGRRK